MSEVLTVKGLSKRFGVVQALDTVSLSFHAGEVLGLVGENGAGKSTLMRLVEGVFPPDAGEIIVDGIARRFAEPREAHALGLRVIHQEPEIVPATTVAENIFAGALPRSGGLFLNRRALHRDAADVLERFGMAREVQPGQLCQTLGPAQRQMVEIMRAVRAGGRVIAFDEPTSSLTDEEARRLFRVIGELRADGACVVYISHRLEEVVALCDRVAVLRDGELVSDNMNREQAAIAQAMVGRPLDDMFVREARKAAAPLLDVEGLTSAAVRDISFCVHAGEVVGIGGLMGAGRSEVARAIMGIDRRLAGTVRMAGTPVPADSPAAAIAAGIGLAPEDRKHEALLMVRSILDNGALCVPEKVSRFGFFSRGRASAIVGRLADRLSIKATSLDVVVSNLSGGNQQKVVLARWLATEPTVLILDEPTRGIDVGAKVEIYRLIDELAGAGIGLLIISSEMPELIGLSDRILVMAEGTITAELSGKDMTETNILHHAMSASARGDAPLPMRGAA